jgi:ketosteroid isomerase-like protein
MRHLVILASLVLATAACREATSPGDAPALSDPALSETAHKRPDLNQERASLIAGGNAVSAAVAQDGVLEGLGGALTGNAVFLSPREPAIAGREAVLAFLAGDPNAPSDLSWEVIVADVSTDGSQGYTWSQGSFTIDLGTGAATTPGFFLTYWRRTAGGRWKIEAFVFNVGGPQPLPLPDGFGTPEKKHRRAFPPTDPQTLRQELRATDKAFSAMSVAEGSGPAFGHFAAPNAIVVGGLFVFGPDAIGEAFTGPPTDKISWKPRFADAAASGDLGFTVGDAVFELGTGTFYSKYLTVWQRQKNGDWRFVADLGSSRPAPAAP